MISPEQAKISSLNQTGNNNRKESTFFLEESQNPAGPLQMDSENAGLCPVLACPCQVQVRALRPSPPLPPMIKHLIDCRGETIG